MDRLHSDPEEFPRWKRGLDLSCIFVSLPVWLPLMVLIALSVKVLSPGPVFFRQERVGYRGRKFNCLKFRSMKVGAETGSHEGHVAELIRSDLPMAKLDAHGDPRLVLGGAIFRASGLDELPQILNVIRGDMSLVGPRPCTAIEFEQYTDSQKARVNAPPGITGEWQVGGKNDRTFGEMIEMDIHYGRSMSFFGDVTILLKTIPAVFREIRKLRRGKFEARKNNFGTKSNAVET
jgi:lipopolysaccharide/colanic/teichoic acid biosynthesis glycosyltransferase